VKLFRKYLYIILYSAALIMIAISNSAEKEMHAPCFHVNNPYQSNTNEISIFDAEDGNYYVFLPAYADMKQVSIMLEGKQTVTLGDIDLYSGMTCGEFELEKPYAFSINNQRVATLWFYQSSNIATMFIDTVSGNMDSIHADKDYEESASIVLYTADGTTDYSDKFITLEGRGNTSWKLDKKSYTITLRQSCPLLNMGSSKKWVLNANGFDASNLRNRMVYEFADLVEKYSAFAPECTYAQVYLNGEYAGLYLLCQKVDAGEDHLNLDQEDFLFEVTMSDRIWHSPSKFWICASRFGEIITPKNFDSNQHDFLQTYVGDFQTALFSDTGIHPETGLAWWEYIDMDSWARKYLIEEVFSNFDSGKASQFFWLDTSEGKLYAGPCWDYDLTFGQFSGTAWYTPYCLLARRSWDEDLSWYDVLCQKDEFIKLVAQIYKTEFRPLLQVYADKEIGDAASSIESAVLSDQLRWPSLYLETEWGTSVESMEEYLRARIEFLDSLWIDNVDYCIITLLTEEVYNLCVPTGSIGTIVPKTHVFGADGPWYIVGTNDPLDETLPIITDLALTARISD